MTKAIVLCEPQCAGFEHVPFNAALLATVLLAFPESPVHFLAEHGHLEQVRSLLQKHDPHQADSVTWKEISIPPRSPDDGWQRLKLEWPWVRVLLQYAEKHKAGLRVCCSITGSGLTALKLMLAARLPRRYPTLAVPHSVLRTVANNPRPAWVGRLNWAVSLRQALRLPNPPGLRLIALGPSILENLRNVLPRAAGHFDVMEHPYLWTSDEACLEIPNRVRLGYFGVRPEGMDQFFELARDIQSEPALKAEFVHIGFIVDPQFAPPADVLIEGIRDTPLTEEEYALRSQSITYAIWLSDPDDFRLRASGSFLDSLSSIKPGIYLRSSYIEHYFEEMGPIGYLCDSIDDVRMKVRDILAGFPQAEYRQQCQTILERRSIFSPPVLALRFRQIVTSLAKMA